MEKEIPIQKMGLMSDYAKNPPDKEKLITAIKDDGISESRFDPETQESVDTKTTSLDFFSTPELSDRERTYLIRRVLGKKDIAQEIPHIQECFESAKSFLHDYLYWSLPRKIQNAEIKTVDDIKSFLEKTKTLAKGDKSIYSPYYCALVKVVIAELEYRKEEFQGFIGETDYIVDDMFGSHGKDKRKYFSHIRKKSDEWDEISVNTGDHLMKTEFTHRGKGHDSVIRKMAVKPEVGAKNIVGDGIGFRFEIDPQDLEQSAELISFLVDYYTGKLGGEGIILENDGIWDETAYSTITEQLRESIPSEMINFPKSKPRASAHDKYVCAKLKMRVEVPREGNKKAKPISRQIEIQLTPRGKKEHGLAKHEAYEEMLKLSATTRLLGSFSRSYLDLICETTAEKAGISPENVKKYLLESGMIRPIRSTETKGARMETFAATEHLKRWELTGMLPESIFWKSSN